MINIENEVFTQLATALRAAYSGIFVKGEYVTAPTIFPCVSVVESDNYTPTERLDSSSAERFSVVAYEINVYSNKTSGKKSECKAIIQTIDEIMYSLNFTRLALTPVQNMEDATVYRMVARYRAETDGTKIYRR